jgi:hypothetical protein
MVVCGASADGIMTVTIPVSSSICRHGDHDLLVSRLTGETVNAGFAFLPPVIHARRSWSVEFTGLAGWYVCRLADR